MGPLRKKFSPILSLASHEMINKNAKANMALENFLAASIGTLKMLERVVETFGKLENAICACTCFFFFFFCLLLFLCAQKTINKKICIYKITFK